MAEHGITTQRTLPELFGFFSKILGPEKPFYTLAIVYGIGISLLSLATPISVQMLINTIINTGLTTQLFILSATLFVLLALAGVLNALRLHIVDVFGRRFYARMVSEIALRSVYALNPYFEDRGIGPLFNRYFDIIIVMKRVPYLLVGGFSILLQAVVGFALTSAYHPAFLAFNLVVIVFIWLIWIIYGKRAIRSAMQLSHDKHSAAAWLEGLGSSNGYFKTHSHVEEALERTDEVTNTYMTSHKLHFRHYFSQAIAFLMLWALASSTLLGLGGWLVIQEQLSIGQLVAAELVLSAVFVGLSQFGTYLSYFYDLCAAIEELSLFYDIEQEEVKGVEEQLPGSGLAMVEARGETRGIDISFNLELPPSALVYARAPSYAVQRLFANFMKRHAEPDGGYITIGGVDTHSISAHSLRQEIIVLDRPNTTSMSIRQYLTRSRDGVNSVDILEVLRLVGLEPIIAQLDDGLDHRIAITGWPLSLAEMMQLKLASAILARPRVLVLSQLYDVLPYRLLMGALGSLIDDAETETTIVYFSNREPTGDFSHFLYMGRSQQRVFSEPVSFCEHFDSRVKARTRTEHGEVKARNYVSPFLGTGTEVASSD
ncbi:MAG: ABC transporter ATP-binding protein [Pseudomonadota bacterium]